MDEILEGLPPIFDKDCKVLLLGSFPSVASRNANMYYSHPQNRFWLTLSQLTNSKLPTSNAEKRELLLSNHIALWDVAKHCNIVKSQDSRSKNIVPNNFEIIFKELPNIPVFTLGKTATNLYEKFTGKSSIYLPSTSPANCAINQQKLLTEFSKILKYLN